MAVLGLVVPCTHELTHRRPRIDYRWCGPVADQPVHPHAAFYQDAAERSGYYSPCDLATEGFRAFGRTGICEVVMDVANTMYIGIVILMLLVFFITRRRPWKKWRR